MMSDAFGTQVQMDFVDFLALIYGRIGALRLTNVTIDAFICNYQCHVSLVASMHGQIVFADECFNHQWVHKVADVAF